MTKKKTLIIKVDKKYKSRFSNNQLWYHDKDMRKSLYFSDDLLYKQAPVFIGTAELISAKNQQADLTISAWKSAYRIPNY